MTPKSVVILPLKIHINGESLDIYFSVESPGAVLYNTGTKSAKKAIMNTIIASVPLVSVLLMLVRKIKSHTHGFFFMTMVKLFQGLDNIKLFGKMSPEYCLV